MANKILYIASTIGHLKSFHLPYLEQLDRDGWCVHAAGRGAQEDLPHAQRCIEISFEKSMFSPKNLQAVRQIARLIREEQYNVISVHTSLAAFFTRLAVAASGRRNRTVVINTVHGYLFDEDMSWLKRNVLLWAEKLTAGSTDLILTMNRQDTCIAQNNRLSGDVRQIRGMGVNYNRFVPANAGMRLAARERFGLNRGAFVLVYAAEFSNRKNQQALIRMLPQLPERVCLLLAGRGAGLEECRVLAQELGVSERIVFAGFVSDVESCYHAADVCVSTSRIEGLPFNLMEAMSCALPVVATEVKGHEDLIQNGENGYLIPFGNWEAMIGRLRELEQQPALCIRLGVRGKELAAQYALEPVLAENMLLMDEYFRSKGVEIPEKELSSSK